jgi:hypothetical protein
MWMPAIIEEVRRSRVQDEHARGKICRPSSGYQGVSYSVRRVIHHSDECGRDYDQLVAIGGGRLDAE